MAEIRVAVAEAKSRFSELPSKVTHANQRIVVTKRQKPIAATGNTDTLRRLNHMEKRAGLLSCVGKWDRFEEITKDVEAVSNARNGEKPRNASLLHGHPFQSLQKGSFPKTAPEPRKDTTSGTIRINDHDRRNRTRCRKKRSERFPFTEPDLGERKRKSLPEDQRIAR